MNTIRSNHYCLTWHVLRRNYFHHSRIAIEEEMLKEEEKRTNNDGKRSVIEFVGKQKKTILRLIEPLTWRKSDFFRGFVCISKWNGVNKTMVIIDHEFYRFWHGTSRSYRHTFIINIYKTNFDKSDKFRMMFTCNINIIIIFCCCSKHERYNIKNMIRDENNLSFTKTLSGPFSVHRSTLVCLIQVTMKE